MTDPRRLKRKTSTESVILFCAHRPPSRLEILIGGKQVLAPNFTACYCHLHLNKNKLWKQASQRYELNHFVSMRKCTFFCTSAFHKCQMQLYCTEASSIFIVRKLQERKKFGSEILRVDDIFGQLITKTGNRSFTCLPSKFKMSGMYSYLSFPAKSGKQFFMLCFKSYTEGNNS